MSKVSNLNKSIKDSDDPHNTHNHFMVTERYYELMTESELIRFLRIPEISGSANYHNVIEHLKRHRGLPRIYICNSAMYPKKAILDWIEKETSD